jgi:hypothetical protein
MTCLKCSKSWRKGYRHLSDDPEDDPSEFEEAPEELEASLEQQPPQAAPPSPELLQILDDLKQHIQDMTLDELYAFSGQIDQDDYLEAFQVLETRIQELEA